MPWSEDRLHRWLARRAAPAVLAGALGDDAAVLRPDSGRSVVCVDATVEGVHFQGDASAVQVGRKAAQRALSDLAASAAEPRAVLLSVSAPRSCDEAWLRRAIGGVSKAAEEHGASLVGGDLTCCTAPISLSVTAIGSLRGRRAVPARSRARVGQRVLLTGPVGGSRLGRHLRIEARVKAGRFLFEAGATAMMDVSDGLAWDLFRLARASGVGIVLDALPVHRDARRAARTSGRSPEWHALHDGEDHELIATLAPRAARALTESSLSARRGRGLADVVAVGRVVEGRGLSLELEGARRSWDLKEGGYRHGDD